MIKDVNIKIIYAEAKAFCIQAKYNFANNLNAVIKIEHFTQSNESMSNAGSMQMKLSLILSIHL